ncbi:MAG: T9SS type A sorting domain-containing protein [Saprospiraceae bacterium]
MKLFLPFLVTLISFAANAQDLVLVSTGASYDFQSYYRLSDDSSYQVQNNTWDIAFTTIGQQDAGVHVNESSRTSFGSPQPEVEVYLAPTNNWEDPIEVDSLKDRLYNDEVSWTYGGAFNQPRDPSDIFDFGWGEYDFMVNQVKSKNIYVIKLRDGSYKKFEIQSIVLTTYNFRYADLDGSNEVSKSLNKADYEFSSFAYFDFASESFINTVPNTWDLEFCRYITPIDAGGGNFIPFGVTGVLSGFGVEVAEARGVDPETVDPIEYRDSFSTVLDVIGYDWKDFENNMAWVLAEDLVYFVKATDDNVYKITFLQFGGSSTGDVIFEKELVDISSAKDLELANGKFVLAPNPARGNTTLLMEVDQSIPNLQINVLDLSGKMVRTYHTAANQGLNAIQMNDLPSTPGIYSVQVTDGEKVSVVKMRVQ